MKALVYISILVLSAGVPAAELPHDNSACPDLSGTYDYAFSTPMAFKVESKTSELEVQSLTFTREDTGRSYTQILNGQRIPNDTGGLTGVCYNDTVIIYDYLGSDLFRTSFYRLDSHGDLVLHVEDVDWGPMDAVGKRRP